MGLTSHYNSSSSNVDVNRRARADADFSVARIREATAKLRALGVSDPEELVRLGAAVMVERCIGKYDERRGVVSVGWLVSAVRQGDAFPDVAPVPRRETASELLLVVDQARVFGEERLAS